MLSWKYLSNFRFQLVKFVFIFFNFKQKGTYGIFTLMSRGEQGVQGEVVPSPTSSTPSSSSTSWKCSCLQSGLYSTPSDSAHYLLQQTLIHQQKCLSQAVIAFCSLSFIGCKLFFTWEYLSVNYHCQVSIVNRITKDSPLYVLKLVLMHDIWYCYITSQHSLSLVLYVACLSLIKPNTPSLYK